MVWPWTVGWRFAGSVNKEKRPAALRWRAVDLEDVDEDDQRTRKSPSRPSAIRMLNEFMMSI